MSVIMAPPVTHEGTKPKSGGKRGGKNVCHLIGADGPLCGERGWGIAVDAGNNLGPICDGPHGCHTPRCPECAAAS